MMRNLTKGGGLILDDSERLDAEIGYGKATGNTASLTYGMDRKEGPLQRFHLSVGYSDKGSQGTMIENSMTLRCRNPLNVRFMYKPELNEANLELDLRY
jgi:hypothetical protein